MTLWIATVPPEDATGALAEAYERQRTRIGHVTKLTQLGSLYPDLVDQRLRLYATVDATPSAIPEAARRAVILLVSALNGCRFCTAGQEAWLREHGHAPLAAAIRADPETATADDAAVAVLLEYARRLTRAPAAIAAADVEALRAAGWDDLAILDVNNLAAYFNYTNRVASGLGLQELG